VQIVPGKHGSGHAGNSRPGQGRARPRRLSPALQIARQKKFEKIELGIGLFTPPPAPPPNRAQAYYHMALASGYEEQAVTEGRPELVTRAIEEYKLALNADPASPQLNLALANLYFRTGRTREAESTARGLLKSSPDDIDAHKLLGRIYLRTLSEGQNASPASSPSGNVLGSAITEFEKIVALQPKNVERSHGSGPALHRQARPKEGRGAVQDSASHGA
jgi:tetratricopeptide (TPR) repeat protein